MEEISSLLCIEFAKSLALTAEVLEILLEAVCFVNDFL